MTKPLMAVLSAAEFNEHYPVGTRVWYDQGKEPGFATYTVSAAVQTEHGPVACIRGMHLPVFLSKLRAYDPDNTMGLGPVDVTQGGRVKNG